MSVHDKELRFLFPVVCQDVTGKTMWTLCGWAVKNRRNSRLDMIYSTECAAVYTGHILIPLIVGIWCFHYRESANTCTASTICLFNSGFALCLAVNSEICTNEERISFLQPIQCTVLASCSKVPPSHQHDIRVILAERHTHTHTHTYVWSGTFW